MKFLSTLALIVTTLSSTAVLAKLDQANLPAALVCTSNANQSEVRKFEITKLNTEEPESSIYDTSFLDLNVLKTKYLVEVSFSNQCDNSYGLVFFYDDLINLQAKKVQKVTALLNYSNADMVTADEEPYTSTVSVECVLK